MNFGHVPVMLREAILHLNILPGSTYIDATFGFGGYSRKILQLGGNVIAIDRDSHVAAIANEVSKEFPSQFSFHSDTFGNIAKYATTKIHGIVADFGISSLHVDDASRGFSFSKEGPLSMQMGINKISAYDIINDFREEKIAEIIIKYGEDRMAKKIAYQICSARRLAPIATTTQLSEIVVKAYGGVAKYQKIHPATLTFQAIRIFINDELTEIASLLQASKNILEAGGRLVCVSFHSLEDSIVKQFLLENSQKKTKVNKYKALAEHAQTHAGFKIITPKPITPSTDEILANPRSRSAKLRCGEKII